MERVVKPHLIRTCFAETTRFTTSSVLCLLLTKKLENNGDYSSVA